MRIALAVLILVASLAAQAQEGDPEIRLVPATDEPGMVNAAPPLEPDSNQVLSVVEEMPQFPGGMPALAGYLRQHIRYPEEAREMKVSGKVFLGFVVEKDGGISDVVLLRRIGHGCDEEALRVVKAMPAWKPGQQGGKPVRVRYTLPINFKLTD